jgi:hypothetical protein
MAFRIQSKWHKAASDQTGMIYFLARGARVGWWEEIQYARRDLCGGYDSFLRAIARLCAILRSNSLKTIV